MNTNEPTYVYEFRVKSSHGNAVKITSGKSATEESLLESAHVFFSNLPDFIARAKRRPESTKRRDK